MPTDLLSLTGKVIVIVGGTSGLGLSAARACIAAGGQVVVVGKEPDLSEAAAPTLGHAAKVLTADAVDPATAPRAIDLAVREFGACHALYHVAGGSGRNLGDGPLHDCTDDGWHATLQLNLTSCFNSNRAAARHFMADDAPGSVLNMASVLAFSPSPRFFSTHAYAAAKSAIIGLTKTAASYYAHHNIRFNALAPALVETRMSRRATEDETIQRFVKSKQPLDDGRMGRPEDLDAAAVYFLSDASRFVTGQVLSIDGGWSVTEGQYPP